MLRRLTQNASQLKKLFLKTNYMFAESLHYIWMFSQLTRAKNVKKLRNKNSFYKNLYSMIKKFEELPLRTKMHILLYHIPVISKLLVPTRNKAVRLELSKNSDYKSMVNKVLNWIEMKKFAS